MTLARSTARRTPGRHYALDAMEVVERPEWELPYAVAVVTIAIEGPAAEPRAENPPPDGLSLRTLLRATAPTFRAEWLFKRQPDGWKIVANLPPPVPAGSSAGASPP